MATNKHAQIRYNTLDKCFSNFNRPFFLEDLVEECRKAIYLFSGNKDGVQERQIYYDIIFMKSDAGWEIPLIRHREGRRVFHRYKNKDFSIRKQPLTKKEAEQLSEAFTMLNRFKGIAQFAWMEEMQVRLEENFGLKENAKEAVGFDSNPGLRGLKHFTPLFNAIVNQKVLNINYKPFNKLPKESILHPYYLKQYNNRWFLFALDNQYKNIVNLALDRIESIAEDTNTYIPNTEIDFDDYFYDVVGVTIPHKSKAEKVILKVDDNRLPYIVNKPLHRSQKVKKNEIGENIIELKVYDNNELQALLFSNGEAIEVLEPESLRKTMKERAEKLFLRYK